MCSSGAWKWREFEGLSSVERVSYVCDTVVNLERASAGFLRGCWLWPVCSQIQHRKSRAVKGRNAGMGCRSMYTTARAA